MWTREKDLIIMDHISEKYLIIFLKSNIIQIFISIFYKKN